MKRLNTVMCRIRTSCENAMGRERRENQNDLSRKESLQDMIATGSATYGLGDTRHSDPVVR